MEVYTLDFTHFLAKFPPSQLKMPSILFLLFIVLFLHLASNSSSTEFSCQTPQPLGMESGQIADWQLTASSTFDATMLGSANARIRKELGGGAWCPQRQIDSQSYEYIQVNLLAPYEIWAIELQGRYGNGSGREFAEAIMVDFIGPTRPRNWTRYGQMVDEDGENDDKNGTRSKEMEQNQHILAANRDERTPELIPLVPPLIASSIRLVPFSLQLRTVCLRFELFGCILPNENALELELIGDNTNSNDGDSWTLAKWRQQIWQRPALLYPLAGLLSLLPLALFLLLLRHLVRLHLQHFHKPSLFSCSTFSSRARAAACFSGSNSSSSSQPLRRSNSWQNVHLPFPFETGIGGFSSARIFSPSFCRFESVSMEFPSLGRKKEQIGKENMEGVVGQQKQQNFGGIWNNGSGEDGVATNSVVEMCRSRSMASGGSINGRRHKMMTNRQQQQQLRNVNLRRIPLQIQAYHHPKLPPILPSPPIPSSSIRTVQLVHSCSQPDSILTLPIHSQHQMAPKSKKPIPKPRSITPLNNITKN